MSTFTVLLDGWSDQSVWGYDPGQHCLYAQLTRDGVDTGDDGPEIWLTPPTLRTLNIETLTRAIARSADVPMVAVAKALGCPTDDALFASG